MLYLKLSKDYDLVEHPTSGAMLIQVAITHAEKSWTAPAVLSKAVWQLLVMNTLWAYASGKPAFAGEITLEFNVHDAQTGELLVSRSRPARGRAEPLRQRGLQFLGRCQEQPGVLVGPFSIPIMCTAWRDRLYPAKSLIRAVCDYPEFLSVQIVPA